MPVTISNESAYVKVTHNDGVVIYYVKASLLIQKHNSNTFSLKCGSVENFYKYTDIATPITGSIDNLLDTIMSWNTSMSNSFQSVNVNTIFFEP